MRMCSKHNVNAFAFVYANCELLSFQVQNNKQMLSLQKHKLADGLDKFKSQEVR